MNSMSAREATQAVSGMRRGRHLAEAIAWVRGGGADLMAGAGHVAVGGTSDRQADREHQPARGAVAPARHSLRDRLSEPVQIMRRPDSCLCVRCGRGKRRARGLTYSNDNQTVGDKMSRTF